ncbi:hypothetical protein WICPIJ_004200 [Wickerhamomyces pijperi]|uniref:Uncharacterized protein n=1 Tax=Wickerhamomyces pijperi TaxID=599730 RepID=A0A9P8Q6F4_WICPI|nr:hypothetical protein WICPIJ_004200 [Wickerhamomyces pijperi]
MIVLSILPSNDSMQTPNEATDREGTVEDSVCVISTPSFFKESQLFSPSVGISLTKTEPISTSPLTEGDLTDITASLSFLKA